MTLNNLLSEPVGWHPIVPPRRHSMPSTPVVTSSEDDSTPTSALNTLVSNLRNRVANGEMIEARMDGTEADLLRELRTRVESISSSLIGNDAALARALVDLLTNLHHLSDIQTSLSQVPSHISKLDKISMNALDKPPPIDVYDTLSRQLSDLQIERLSSQASNSTQQLSTPAVAFEASLLWSRIDAELEKVVMLCKQRFVTLSRPSHDYLPPKYDGENYDDLDLESLPDYEAKGRISLEEPKSPKAGSFQSQQTSRVGDEKMRMDLEAVAMAIERLYIVTPQLHNQRVELKSSKMEELAKAEASSRASSFAKGKERDLKELEKIVQLIGKASERTYRDQSVILDGDMQNRLEKAKRDETAKASYKPCYLGFFLLTYVVTREMPLWNSSFTILKRVEYTVKMLSCRLEIQKLCLHSQSSSVNRYLNQKGGKIYLVLFRFLSLSRNLFLPVSYLRTKNSWKSTILSNEIGVGVRLLLRWLGYAHRLQEQRMHL